MPQLVSTKCPNCGASVSVDPERGSATCQYCGSESVVARPAPPAPLPPPMMSPPVYPVYPVYPQPTARRSGPGVAVTIGILVLVAAGGAVAVLTGSSRSATSQPQAQQKAGEPVAVGASPAAPPPVLVPDASRQLLLADLDGDPKPELVVAFHASGAQTVYGFAALDGATGAVRFKTPDLGSKIYGFEAAVVGRRLLVANEQGELSAYDGAGGAKLWSTALGDRAVRFCLPPASLANSVLVNTKDERQLVVELGTGKQRPAEGAEVSKTCALAPADHAPQRDPYDFSDSTAPADVESYTCGGIDVRGSRTFYVADRCEPKAGLRPGKLGDLEPDAIWRHPAGWLVFGHKAKGTSVPMIGLGAKNALAWSADVPSGNPLEASEGRPSVVAATADAVVVAYGLRAGGARVATFAIADGARRWEATPRSIPSIEHVAVAAGIVYVAGDRHVAALDLRDGHELFVLGEP